LAWLWFLFRCGSRRVISSNLTVPRTANTKAGFAGGY